MTGHGGKTHGVGVRPGHADAVVFVIDDTQANVVLLERLITSSFAGIGVRGFTDPAQALSELTRCLPDLVLLDLRMPGLDGFAVLDRLSELVPKGDYLPVLMLTADVDTGVKQRALASGAHDFLTKPFDHAEVLLRVSNLLETRSLYRRLGQDKVALQAELDTRLVAERADEEERALRLTRVQAALAPGAITMVFQPVADIQAGTVVGAEALARFGCAPQRPPNEWFTEADEAGHGVQLEMAAATAALDRLPDLPAGTFLAVNVSPATAATAELEELLADRDAARMVVEITEHKRVDDYDSLLGRLDRLRERGVRVAVDDAGAGYSGLQRLLRIRPEIIKMDIALTRDIDTDPVRRALATALLTFADETGAMVVAEGVETAGELATLRQLGVSWAQGYHLARPQELPLPEVHAVTSSDPTSIR